MKLILFILLQGGPPPPDDWGDPDIPDVPITDQIWILFALALIYGAFKIYKSIKKAPN